MGQLPGTLKARTSLASDKLRETCPSAMVVLQSFNAADQGFVPAGVPVF
jgi:hypothetical protein